MNAPIILTTTTYKETLRRRHEQKKVLGHMPEAKFIRIMLDAFDILRVIEVQKDADDSDEPLCKIHYALEDLTKEDDQWIPREVQHVTVKHSLDEIHSMMEDAKREKPEWDA